LTLVKSQSASSLDVDKGILAIVNAWRANNFVLSEKQAQILEILVESPKFSNFQDAKTSKDPYEHLRYLERRNDILVPLSKGIKNARSRETQQAQRVQGELKQLEDEVAQLYTKYHKLLQSKTESEEIGRRAIETEKKLETDIKKIKQTTVEQETHALALLNESLEMRRWDIESEALTSLDNYKREENLLRGEQENVNKTQAAIGSLREQMRTLNETVAKAKTELEETKKKEEQATKRMELMQQSFQQTQDGLKAANSRAEQAKQELERAKQRFESVPKVLIDAAGKNLDKKDLFGNSYPILRFHRALENGTRLLIHETGVLKKTLNPTWPPFEVTIPRFCGGDYGATIAIECYHWDAPSEPELIGFTETTLKDMIESTPELWLVNKDKQIKDKKNYKHSGLLVLKARVFNVAD